MSEKIHGKVEAPRHDEQLDTHETAKKNLERLKEKAEKADHDHSIDKIQASIHKEALSAKEITVGEHRKDTNQPLLGVQKELKADAYRRTLRKIRGQLSAPQRGLSKVMHHPVMEPINEVGSKTVARPSGLLGGGLAALVGSGTVLYMAKHYGFSYNFTTFIILLSVGFITGVLIEVVMKLARRGRA
jgi:hypothetical protein